MSDGSAPLLVGEELEKEYRSGSEVVRVLRGASVTVGAGEVAGGEQQRVAIARAIINRPKVILADEPTGNLDPKTSEVIYDLCLRLQAERGLAFLVATHNPDLARKAERGYRLVDGRAREVRGGSASIG